MNKDRHEEFLKHIKSRESYSEPFFYISDLLNDSGVGNYKQICADRIADAYLIDSVHVTIDLFGKRPGEILVDRVGIRKCESVLKSYVTDEKFNDYLEYIDLLSLESNLKNDQLALLQSYTEVELKNLIDETNATDEDLEDIRKEFETELESRKPFRVIKGKGSRVSRLKEEIKHQALKRKYRKMVQSSISSVSEELIKQHIVKRNSDRREYLRNCKWIVHLEAFEHFVHIQGGVVDVSSLTREENMKYAYWGVNRYGKFYRDQRKEQDKNQTSVKKEYDAFSSILESLSRLTPTEIQQIFPIEKRYDGNKYGAKDYFYTIKRLSRLDKNEPISKSSNVESILWDYTNNNIEYFAVHYMGNLSDHRTYLNDDSKDKEFFRKLEEGCRE